MTKVNNKNSGSSTRRLIDEIEDEDVHEDENEIEFVEDKHLDPKCDQDLDKFDHKEEVVDAQI